MYRDQPQPPMTEAPQNYTESYLRKNLISESIAKKKRAASTITTSVEKYARAEFPQLFNKYIVHKWIHDGKEEWIRDKILKALGDVNNIDHDFEVKYTDEDGNLVVKLYEDLQNGDSHNLSN